MLFFTFLNRFYKGLLIGMLILMCFSCEKTDLSPVLGNYDGETEIRSRDFQELLDADGNFVGVEAIFDTSFTQGDIFMVLEGDEDGTFTVSGSGSLARINSFSNHTFTYQGQTDFSVVDISDGVENRRLEFTVDGSGNISLMYRDNFETDNRPPTGQDLIFSGSVK